MRGRPGGAYVGVQKPMRKGTRSCLACRRRKIRCISREGEESCKDCQDRGTPCTAQGIAQDEQSANPRQPDEIQKLQTRVAELESLVKQLTNAQGSSDTASPGQDLLRASPAEALNLLQARIVDSVGQQSHCNDDSTSLQRAHEGFESTTDGAVSKAAPIMNLFKSVMVSCDVLAHPDTPSDQSAELDLSNLRLPGTLKLPERHAIVLKDLCASLPPQAKMAEIFQYRSSWWPLWRATIGHDWSGNNSKTLEEFAGYVFSDGHPCLVALLLVFFAQSTYELDTYVAPVERCIVSNDEYAGSDAGLLCLLALGLCYINTRPCRAWITIRKAITLLQLRDVGHHIKRSERLDVIFWQLLIADRSISLLIGAPYMMPHHFYYLDDAVHDNTPFDVAVPRRMAVLIGHVVDCVQGVVEPNLHKVLEVEGLIDKFVSSLPPHYLDRAHINQNTDKVAQWVQLSRVIQINQLKAYLHLPLLLKTHGKGRFGIVSRMTCIDSCRELLLAFLDICDVNPAVAGEGNILNFYAFTAAAVLILGLLYFDPPMNDQEGLQVQPKHVQDWQIVNRALEVLEISSRGALDQLCGRCYTALKTLANSQDVIKEGETISVGLPYIGSISIALGSNTTCQPATNSSAQPSHHPQIGSMDGVSWQLPPQASSLTTYDTNDLSFQYHGPFLHDDSINDNTFEGLFTNGFDWSRIDVDQNWDWLEEMNNSGPAQ